MSFIDSLAIHFCEFDSEVELGLYRWLAVGESSIPGEEVVGDSYGGVLEGDR